MKIIFVRHGESEHNARKSDEKNTPLTKKGREQAISLGKRLRKYKISSIYTSTLLRAKETGKIVSDIIKVPIKGSFGELDEYPSDYLKMNFWRFLHRTTNKRFKDMKKLLDDISRNKTEDRAILIVAHGITNRIIIGHFLEFPIRKELLRFNQENTCVNILVWKKEFNNWSIDCLNDRKHLPLNLISKTY